MNQLFRKDESRYFSKLLEEGVVSFLNTLDRDQTLYELVGALKEEGKISKEEEFYQAILKREAIVSTGVGMGVAIPHAKLPIFQEFFIAIGIQKGKKGIEWHSLDQAPVKLIFMIGGPVDQQTRYLKILSHLTASIKDEEKRKSLLRASSKEEVISLIIPALAKSEKN
ncbi:MAG: PTS sugar transporter subunit IIA [Simkania negevensis]|nr:PTS sugar transporter subunit IIA [Simkania negevensis]